MLLQREGKNIVCYCTGTQDSGDVVAARSVAEDLGLELKTTIIDEPMVEQILPEIIRNVEESGLLQVEVAIPMYLAAKLAAEDHIRVMFTGQAADELFAGYPWYNDVLDEFGYLRLHEKLWEDLTFLYTDTLEREDKLTMAHSIELRAPYLDRDVIQTAMRISPRLKTRGEKRQPAQESSPASSRGTGGAPLPRFSRQGSGPVWFWNSWYHRKNRQGPY